MLEQCCNPSKHCRKNVATLCCAKNRRCESSRVTIPLKALGFLTHFHNSFREIPTILKPLAWKKLTPFGRRISKTSTIQYLPRGV